ncbi:hypothetical protein PM082_022881 [Marasmius tenuissimus]|nr:hypothetical protein PM082_022881 [Marasmius tenuissimus]
MSHLEDGKCLNSQPDLKNYSVVATDSHINNCLTSLTSNPPSKLPRHDAPWSLVGTIWLMWNSQFGIPAECKTCGMVICLIILEIREVQVMGRGRGYSSPNNLQLTANKFTQPFWRYGKYRV